MTEIGRICAFMEQDGKDCKERPLRELDVQQLVKYIQLSQNYDGGIGLGPGLESHGGSTYCAVAAYVCPPWLRHGCRNSAC